MTENSAYEPVHPEILSGYQLYPILCNHYTRDAAFSQKVGALIHRTETQARDVFDLNLLMDAGATVEKLPKELRSDLDAAIENAISVSYSDYKAQVASYLAPEHQHHYATDTAWSKMQERLLAAFESTKKKARR